MRPRCGDAALHRVPSSAADEAHHIAATYNPGVRDPPAYRPRPARRALPGRRRPASAEPPAARLLRRARPKQADEARDAGRLDEAAGALPAGARPAAGLGRGPVGARDDRLRAGPLRRVPRRRSAADGAASRRWPPRGRCAGCASSASGALTRAADAPRQGTLARPAPAGRAGPGRLLPPGAAAHSRQGAVRRRDRAAAHDPPVPVGDAGARPGLRPRRCCADRSCPRRHPAGGRRPRARGRGRVLRPPRAPPRGGGARGSTRCSPQHPRERYLHYGRGLALAQQGSAEALDAFRKEIELFPDDVLARVELGFGLLARGREAEAVAPAEEAVRPRARPLRDPPACSAARSPPRARLERGIRRAGDGCGHGSRGSRRSSSRSRARTRRPGAGGRRACATPPSSRSRRRVAASPTRRAPARGAVSLGL